MNMEAQSQLKATKFRFCGNGKKHRIVSASKPENTYSQKRPRKKILRATVSFRQVSDDISNHEQMQKNQ